MNRTTLLRTLLLAAVLFPLLLPAAPDAPRPTAAPDSAASIAAPDTTALTAAPTNPTREELDSIRRVGESFEVRVPNRICALIDINMPRSLIGTGRRLFQVRNHPGLDSLFTEAEMAQIRAEIDARCDSLGKDSLLSSELFYVCAPTWTASTTKTPTTGFCCHPSATRSTTPAASNGASSGHCPHRDSTCCRSTTRSSSTVRSTRHSGTATR